MMSPPESLKVLLDVLGPSLGRVERVLAQESHSYDRLTVTMSSQLAQARGKRVRPALTLLWWRALAPRRDRAASRRIERLAAMVEMIHTASVVHDDMIDDSALRRGRDTLHMRWGDKLSILMGDFLYAKSATLIASDGTMEVLDVVSAAVARMCRGEMRELAAARKVALTEREYEVIATEKTADLFSAACEVGAIMAGADRPTRAKARIYGGSLGLAFQIVDDVLDWTSSGQELGKPVGADLKEGRVTLPVILALRNATTGERRAVARAYARGASAPFSRVKRVVDRRDGVAQAMARARARAERARGASAGLPPGPARLCLEELVRFVLARTH